MRVSYTQLRKLVNTGAKDGFTTALHGTTKRYVVAYTHNTELDIKELMTQINTGNIQGYNNINVGGWTDTETGVKYIDISTSFDSLKEAKEFALEHDQIALWDSKEFKEIRTK